MYLYIDTEFTGLHKETELISLGAVSSEGDIFYWVDNKTPIIKHQMDHEMITDIYTQATTTFQQTVTQTIPTIRESMGCSEDGKEYVLYCGTDNMKESLIEFINSIYKRTGEKIVPILDVGHYDWVLIMDLFGHALNIPEAIHYIPLDLATMMADKLPNVDGEHASDASRVGLIEEHTDIPIELIRDNAHNAIIDAFMIKIIHEKILNKRTD